MGIRLRRRIGYRRCGLSRHCSAADRATGRARTTFSDERKAWRTPSFRSVHGITRLVGLLPHATRSASKRLLFCLGGEISRELATYSRLAVLWRPLSHRTYRSYGSNES